MEGVKERNEYEDKCRQNKTYGELVTARKRQSQKGKEYELRNLGRMATEDW